MDGVVGEAEKQGMYFPVGLSFMFIYQNVLLLYYLFL